MWKEDARRGTLYIIDAVSYERWPNDSYTKTSLMESCMARHNWISRLEVEFADGRKSLDQLPKWVASSGFVWSWAVNTVYTPHHNTKLCHIVKQIHWATSSPRTSNYQFKYIFLLSPATILPTRLRLSHTSHRNEAMWAQRKVLIRYG